MQHHAIFICSYHGGRFPHSPDRLRVRVQQAPSKCGETSGSVPYCYCAKAGKSKTRDVRADEAIANREAEIGMTQ